MRLRVDVGVTGTLILTLLFVIVMFPFAVTWVMTYPDEPQYLDAGVLMCETNDWLMPACPNNAAPGDMKPIFTYWIVALSYKLFGMSVAAARLPYLLAGIFVIALTYRLALTLTVSPDMPTGSRSAAALACVLLLCNPVFWLSAVRCIPDIWLCLFMLVSAWGFIGLLTTETPTTRHALLAYVGIGLAVLTKGLPALVFLGYVAAFTWFNPWRPRCWRRLIHGPAMALGATVALSWFVIVLFTHGPDTLRHLWSDQVGTRAQLNSLIVAYRFPIALAVLTLAHLPFGWPVLRMGERWRTVLPETQPQRVACAFIGPWVALNVLAMCAAHDWYVRYLLPAFPLLSIVLGMALAKVGNELLTRCFRRLLTGMVALFAIIGLVALIVGIQLGVTGPDLAIGLMPGLAVGLAAYLGFLGSWLRSAQAVAAVSLMSMPLVYFSASKVGRRDLEERIVKQVQREDLSTHSVAGFVGPKAVACRIRMAVAGRVELRQWGKAPPNVDDFTLLILPQESAAHLPAGKYAIRPAGSVFGSPEDDEIMHAILNGRLGECLERRRVPYCVAIRIDSTVQP